MTYDWMLSFIWRKTRRKLQFMIRYWMQHLVVNLMFCRLANWLQGFSTIERYIKRYILLCKAAHVKTLD